MIRPLTLRLAGAALAGVAVAIVSLAAPAQDGAKPSAQQIFERSSATEKVADWQADSQLGIRQGERVRSRGGVVYNKLQADAVDSHRLFRFATPADVAGTAVLVHENAASQDDLWIYFPSMGKTRRILASNKKDSFMGSDFAYADLMAQDSADFTHSLLADEPCASATCYVVQSVPRDAKTAASLGYSKLVATVRKHDFAAVLVRYFDKSGQEFKRQTISGHLAVANQPGKLIATRREMVAAKGGRSSVLTLKNVNSNRALREDLFIESRLGQ
ncbi:hypothetical protein GLA29479_2675 [Lysobacter antibioticus]|uniref:outer membrane lipoprotein-sorting protein n=1 Tax=Lysobacter antibioticus TaxID=84531 RepID=UPI000716EE81|nr:outer membrane lipoprotein-sorting protein [Lysobacter antibioticus]ALN63541.1 hypothetical protein GLA29479_2675 [Lysobacter antibioticus]